MRTMSIEMESNFDIEFMYNNLIIKLIDGLDYPIIRFVKMTKVNNIMVFDYEMLDGDDVIYTYTFSRNGENYSFRKNKIT